MEWQQLKRKIYHEDGSLRDLYVLHTSEEDWQKWVTLVNTAYRVEFFNGAANAVEKQIDFQLIAACWSDTWSNFDASSATIRIRDIRINCHFFGSDDIENDIQPKEIRSVDDHHAVLAYMQAVSVALGKPIRLTEENSRNAVLIEVSGSVVRIIPN